MVNVELFNMNDGARLAEALAVRLRVFVLEQGVPFEEEIDEHDCGQSTVHALARDVAGRVLGTGRYYERDADSVQIGRMAVERESRGAGAGAAILNALVAEARSRDFARAVLLAQLTARKFYERYGFVASGPVVVDAGIDHVFMSCEL